jgi:hypothetical protein
MTNDRKIAVGIACCVLAASAFLIFVPPIAQSQDYHAFADVRESRDAIFSSAAYNSV